jgi:hypothetical protein
MTFLQDASRFAGSGLWRFITADLQSRLVAILRRLITG